MFLFLLKDISNRIIRQAGRTESFFPFPGAIRQTGEHDAGKQNDHGPDLAAELVFFFCDRLSSNTPSLTTNNGKAYINA
ncbi:hypothetical protein TH62_04780 [Bacillus sp. TH008]|nr:hypothetical protein TH62_04780 [Bacillus sp. TH008]